MAGDNFVGVSPIAGKTSISIPIRLISSAGAGVTGKVATNLTGSYWRQGGTRTAISLSDLAAVNSAYSSGGVKEVDSTNLPGIYRLDLPDAAIATGVDWVVIGVVCSGAVDYEVFIVLSDAIPGVAAGASGGLPTAVDASGRVDLGKWLGSAPNALINGRVDTLLNIAHSGTLQGSTGDTVTLAAGASATDNLYSGCWIAIVSGTGVGQTRLCVGYVGATKIATVFPQFTTFPNNTSVAAVMAIGGADIEGIAGLDVNSNAISANVTQWRSSTPNALSGGAVPANVQRWNSVAIATPDTAGYPKVTVKSGTGTGEISLSGGAVTVGGYASGEDPATLLLDGSNGVETGFTLRQALRLILAMAAGKLSISGNTVTIRDVNDSKDRITATTDSNGQRTAVTKDVS